MDRLARSHAFVIPAWMPWKPPGATNGFKDHREASMRMHFLADHAREPRGKVDSPLDPSAMLCAGR